MTEIKQLSRVGVSDRKGVCIRDLLGVMGIFYKLIGIVNIQVYAFGTIIKL